jgi:hypothetical protein
MVPHEPLRPLKSAARCAQRPQLAEGQQLLTITATAAAVEMLIGTGAEGEFIT